MDWLNRLLGRAATTTSTTTTTVEAPKPNSSPTSPQNSALAPTFDRDVSKFRGQIRQAMEESKDLGATFKACLMLCGVANTAGAPKFYGYGTHKPMTMSLTKKLPDDRLDLVVCLNVSGHDFKDGQGNRLPDAQQRLEARARDNRYVIQVTHPDGRVEKMTDIEAKGALSTAQDISIKGMKPGVTVVEAWPEGSARVGGYVEGRRLEITYNPPGAAVDRFG